MKMSRLEVLANFGFQRDPFNGTFETADMARVKRLIGLAVSSGALLSVVGDRGIGKTMAVNAALHQLSARVVRPHTPDRPRLTIGDIEQAMIMDLSEEAPKRNKEVRIRQLRRILGEARQKNPIVVVLEEGHRFHGATLRALKTLRELEFAGRTNLFACVMVSQSDPMLKAGVSEVRLRSDSIQMQGLTGVECSHYLGQRLGEKISKEAILAIRDTEAARNFLELQQLTIHAMTRALIDGRTVIGSQDVIGEKPKADLPKQPAHNSALLKNIIKKRRHGSETDEETAEGRTASASGY